jgi:ferric-dicitrate binding protein FerR (iron transport regulator)
MDKDKELQVIEQALNAATLKGVYNLNDVATSLQALMQLKGE